MHFFSAEINKVFLFSKFINSDLLEDRNCS